MSSRSIAINCAKFRSILSNGEHDKTVWKSLALTSTEFQHWMQDKTLAFAFVGAAKIIGLHKHYSLDTQSNPSFFVLVWQHIARYFWVRHISKCVSIATGNVLLIKILSRNLFSNLLHKRGKKCEPGNLIHELIIEHKTSRIMGNGAHSACIYVIEKSSAPITRSRLLFNYFFVSFFFLLSLQLTLCDNKALLSSPTRREKQTDWITQLTVELSSS